MKSIKKFLQTYLNKKIRIDVLNFLIKFFIFFLIYISLLIFIEKNAFLTPNIKIKIFDITYTIIIFNVVLSCGDDGVKFKTGSGTIPDGPGASRFRYFCQVLICETDPEY